MAYVAISTDLRENVRLTINSKMQAEKNLTTRPGSPSISNTDPRLMQKLWGDHLALKDVIPLDWCTRTDSLSLFTTFPPDPDNPSSHQNMTVSAVLIGGNIYGPPRSDTYNLKLTLPPDAPEVVEHVQYTQTIHAIELKWRKVREDVLSFLENCKSLNEALKLWPDIRIYIPANFLARAEEKTVKAKAAESKAMEILKQIDTDHAISSAVMVRILEANKHQETT